jgi:hypothetical protein
MGLALDEIVRFDLDSERFEVGYDFAGFGDAEDARFILAIDEAIFKVQTVSVLM